MGTKNGYLWSAVVLCLICMCSLQFLIEFELLQPLSSKLDDLGKESVAKQRHNSDSVRVVPKTQLQMDAILLRLPNSSLPNDRLIWLHHQADDHGVVLRRPYRLKLSN